MKSFAIVAAALTAGFTLAAADPALARAKHHHAKVKQVRCEDRYVTFSWDFIWALRPDPQPNGCARPAYDAGRYVAQDPDRNIRHQLRRDPEEYYTTR